MPFTQKYTLATERLLADQWAVTGRTTTYNVFGAALLGADVANDQIHVLSGGVSAIPITLTPLGISNTAMQLFLVFNYPVDIRTNAPNDPVFLSAVTFWAMQGRVSNLYVSPGSNDTTMWLQVAGGSNATPQWTFPLQ